MWWDICTSCSVVLFLKEAGSTKKFGVSIAFTGKGASVAAAIMAFTLMVRSMRLSLGAIDRRLEAAALILGASRLCVFLTISLPFMTSGILSGCVLVFAHARGEFGPTMTFVSNVHRETQTFTLAICNRKHSPDGETGALRFTIFAVAIALVALFSSEWLARHINQQRPPTQ